MADRTNRYKRPDHRVAYEDALRRATAMDEIDYLAIAKELDHSIAREKRKQIAAKAARVARARRHSEDTPG